MKQKRLRITVLALVAVLAISAVAASAASAGTFKAASYPAKITGEQSTQVLFSGVVGTWKCNKLTMLGELKAESSALNLAPTYTECSWAGIAATTAMEGCTYEYIAGNTIEENKNKIQVTMNVRCPVGKEVKLTLTNGCTIRIPEQTALSSATAENKLTAPGDVDLQLGLTGIKYIIENGAVCPNKPEDGPYTNGKLSGGVTLRAENSESKLIAFSIE